MTPTILVSSYAASPAHTHWDAALEHELLAGLCALPDVAGLEVPWLGAPHPHDVEWFLRSVPAGARLSLTPLPWVMRRCAEAPGYGVASPDADGRAAALGDLSRVAQDARRISDESAATVALVGVHTAPRGGGSVDALARSLDEIASWDWGEAELVIEHCDAPTPGLPFEKGFLHLDDELDALQRSGAPVGIWLNWGRSAIELRAADAVTAQIADAAETGRLAGLTFSGAAAVDGPYGPAWADAHLPLLSADPDSASLLDDARVTDALIAAGDVPRLGLKVSRRPTDRTAQDVIRTVARNLDVIRAARPGAGERQPVPRAT